MEVYPTLNLDLAIQAGKSVGQGYTLSCPLVWAWSSKWRNVHKTTTVTLAHAPKLNKRDPAYRAVF